jgi:cell division protein FtsI (penicillin-binding protein 3)
VRDFKTDSKQIRTSRWIRFRVGLLAIGFFALLTLGLFRAIKLQVFDRQKLLELAEDQYMRRIEIPAKRGDIFDRRGVPLAQSAEVDSLWIDPELVSDLRQASRELARRLNLDPGELHRRLQHARRFAWIKRQAKPDEVRAALALGIPGLAVTKEPRRFYPQRELAAQLLGMTGTDGAGLEGLELSFNDELSGQTSKLLSLRDAKGRKLLTEFDADQRQRRGASLQLTIDRQIQFVAEKALSRAVDESRAVAGMAVVLDPRTGELLAVANFPPFNPNAPSLAAAEAYRNRAALDAFEPGSTFKAFTVAAALDENVIRTSDLIFCENGGWVIGRHTIHDTHPHGWLTPGKILQVSSNIGAAKIAQLLGRERLVAYAARFGFGQPVGLGLPGESKGSVPYPKADLALATAAFGQGLSVTAIQLAAAYGAIANGGVLMKPFLVRKLVDPDGLVLFDNRPTPIRRAVSEGAARQVMTLLETVVQKEGTAPRARMEEFRVAGKTGTAQKPDPVARGYSDKRIASFIGIVPADAPRAVILVVIDEPKTDVFGGLVAAPAFKDIAAAALPYLGISRGESARGDEAQVPNVVGKRVDAVGETVLAAAAEPQVFESGSVAGQNPSARRLVQKGSPVWVEPGARQ